jgi:hypothetical protein
MVESAVAACITFLIVYPLIGLFFVYLTIMDTKRLINEAGGLENYSNELSKSHPEITFRLLLISIIIFDFFLWPIAACIVLMNSAYPGSNC